MKNVLAILAALIISTGAYAQIEHPVNGLMPQKEQATMKATIFLKATIADGWHIYSQHVKDGVSDKNVVYLFAVKSI